MKLSLFLFKFPLKSSYSLRMEASFLMFFTAAVFLMLITLLTTFVFLSLLKSSSLIFPRRFSILYSVNLPAVVLTSPWSTKIFFNTKAKSFEFCILYFLTFKILKVVSISILLIKWLDNTLKSCRVRNKSLLELLTYLYGKRQKRVFNDVRRSWKDRF